ncbi:MAG: helix-turn-helix domain-containing protein, partial [Deltaproteobacteria bacterium]
MKRLNAIAKPNLATLAKRAGISDQLMRKYVQGSVPGADIVLAISRAAGVSVEWLLTGVDRAREASLTVQTTPRFKAFHRDFAMDQFIPVRLLADSVAAGTPLAVNETDVAGWCLIYADRAWIPGDPE